MRTMFSMPAHVNPRFTKYELLEWMTPRVEA